ncbi:MAG: radical SAM protein [Candidatus Buchananbacteria bacterium]|nr:radical SAM protein [Candidatus Buchananbacteria bacterium]
MSEKFKFLEIVIILTRSCNKKECSYCQVKKDYKVNKLENNLYQLIEFLKNSPVKSVRFLGGEPLLKYKKIKQIIKNLPDKNFIINTNGLLLTKAKSDFFKKYNIKIILSHDGQEPDLKINRYYTDKQIAVINENLINLENYQKQTQINLTVSPQTIDNLYNNLAYIYKLGFKKINILPVFYQNWPQSQLRLLKLELSKILVNLNKFKQLELINLKSFSYLPLFKNSLLIDCDGNIFFSTAVIEKFFHQYRKEFIKANMMILSEKKKNYSELNFKEIEDYNKKIDKLIINEFSHTVITSTEKVNRIFENFINKYLKINKANL